MSAERRRGERRHVVIHAHCYQPPREDPEFDEVETEASAAPWHDWNERIERECYRALVAARVHGDDSRIATIVNTLEWISFDVGPTLFAWLARHAPDTARRIVAADRASVARLGHGNAIAHPYHHVILPLASRRDKVTEVRWGIADFRRRFGREPEGMWLPETAVDDETLDVLAQEKIRFTVVAPAQVRGAPPNGHPGLYRTANGREIALFIYDGDLSHGIAFGGLVRNADHWLDALWQIKAVRTKTPGGTAVVDREPLHPLLVSAATDGETYGHHHPFAELALARVLERTRHKGGHLDNYAAFLAHHPAHHEVSLVAPSAWSCTHGVDRWRADCGCRMDTQLNPSQRWRAPLRDGLATLAAELHDIFGRDAGRYFADPWAVRDAWGEGASERTMTEALAFVRGAARPGTPETEFPRAVALLEMERDTLRMFTSCAWFFDDIGGLEPRQVLRYARRALALSGATAQLEPPLVATLAQAVSNDPKVGTGADVYRALVPPFEAPVRAAAAARALDTLGLLSTEPLLGARAVDVGPFHVQVDDDEVHVCGLTALPGRTYRVRVAAHTARELACEVVGADGDAHTVLLADIPERERLRVRHALRDALLARCLTGDELAALASGAASLRELAAAALERALRQLDGGVTPASIAVVESHLDLFEQLETRIPFDAQTVFWDLWGSLAAARRPALQGIARRLGFTGD